jgi:starch phosphorylase
MSTMAAEVETTGRQAARLESFRVVPSIPEKLAALEELAYNLLWSWDEELRVPFTRLDRELWEATYQNPVLMLGRVSQGRLDELAADEGYLSVLEQARRRLHAYLEEPTWWDKRYPSRPLVAYFSAEFGIAECLPIYSGGLGVLAGHHLKSASDLGVPLVGVGLLYQQGYFRQYLTPDGWQQEDYPANDFYNLPVQPAAAADGSPLRVDVPVGTERVVVQVWKAQVGRIPLFLLDTNLPENPRELQDVTDALYGGEQRTRIRQELVLGVGGFRALRKAGLRPAVCHMNEGHSAFLALERIATLMREERLAFAEAYEVARAGDVFTTHTAVPAGFDLFPVDMVEEELAGLSRESGIDMKELLPLGRAEQASVQTHFNMAALALRASSMTNGVSRLHGEVTRKLLSRYVPDLPAGDLPVTHVTNGAHTRSSVSKEMAGLFDRYLGLDWSRRLGQNSTWTGVDSIPDEELWATHERRRERLVAFARRRLARQLQRRGATPRDVEHARGVLDTRALTIGFARRFATYKRADLILADLERLRKILKDAKRPVQILFAGKAHPRDTEAKEVLKRVVAFCGDADVRRHAVFLEDYDLVTARYLVQGCDVWLNTPRRGQEASGTSGMKVVPNGGLNLSVLDGWWCEAYSPEVGWAIGQGEDYEDHAYQDQVESGALYDLLEREIVPLFYARAADGLPRAWIARMKRSMRTLTPTYSTHRMLWEYAERHYLPAAELSARLREGGYARARDLAQWKRRIVRGFPEVRVVEVRPDRDGVRRVGESYGVRASVWLGALAPEDVSVELYAGPLDTERRIIQARTSPMHVETADVGGAYEYAGEIACGFRGLMGYTVRVVPFHPDAHSLLATGLAAWR